MLSNSNKQELINILINETSQNFNQINNVRHKKK